MGQGLIVFWLVVTLFFASRKALVIPFDTDVLSVAGVITVGAAQLFPGSVWLTVSLFFGLGAVGVVRLFKLQPHLEANHL